MDRAEALTAIQQNPDVTVLIVGAGVNGIGTFRDLALQGIDVLMIDKADFCSGASAASSHMVHGGIRYLENGEFRLVREAVQERNRLLRNCPQYVRPLATTIPIFSWFSGLLNAPLKFAGMLRQPAERGVLVIKMGLMLYDAYTRQQGTVPRHKMQSRKEALTQYPKLNPNIVRTATYYDAAMVSPERICIELLLDAEASSSQVKALNYVRLTGASGDTVTLQDEVTGETLTVRPQIVINAAGPWIDFANQSLGKETRFIGGTKGSHLVLDHPELRAAIGDHEFFFENEDGRIVLIYPLLDKILVGTSDIPIDDPDLARCTEEEVDYFLEMIGRVFPTIEVARHHIVFRFSGVRPLPASDAATAGQISRDHSIRTLEPGEEIAFPVYNLIGGKWTTFRAFAEKVTDRMLERLGRPRLSSTDQLPIGGGRNYPFSAAEKAQWMRGWGERLDIDRQRLETLFERYGTRATVVADFILAGPDEPLQYRSDYSRREISFLAREEKVIHLDDLILRRTLLAMLGHLSEPLLHELADVVGEALDWTPDQRAAEIDRSLTTLAVEHQTTLRAVDGIPVQTAGAA